MQRFVEKISPYSILVTYIKEQQRNRQRNVKEQQRNKKKTLIKHKRTTKIRKTTLTKCKRTTKIHEKNDKETLTNIKKRQL